MNYQKIYNNICNRGKQRILDVGVYSERHHIIPKCLGGTDVDSNITILTAKEHYLCHLILSTKLYPDNYKLAYALYSMCVRHKDRTVGYVLSSRKYDEIRIRSIKLMGDYKRTNPPIGKKNGMFGRHHTDETREKQSEIRKEWIRVNGHPNLGNKYSDDIRHKISEIKKQQWRGGDYDMDAIRQVSSIRAKMMWNNEAHRTKLMNYLTSTENRKRISEFSKSMWSSDEFRRKMSIIKSETQMGNDNNNARPIIDTRTGVVYGSRKEASVELGISRYMVSVMLKSGVFIDGK